MPKDFLFPNLPGVSGVTTLTADSLLGTAMLGTLVQLAGFTLTLAALEAGDFGVICVAGPGSIGGELEQDLADNEVTLIAVQGAAFDWIQSSGPGGAVSISEVTGLTAALAAKAATLDVANALALKANAAEVIRFEPAVTGLNGGGAGTLEGIATVALPVGSRIQFIVDGVLLTYRLTAVWNLFATGMVQVTPLDHHGVSNIKYWDLVQAGVGISALLGASADVAALLSAQDDAQLRGALGVRDVSSVVSVRPADEPPGMGSGVQAVGGGFTAEPGETVPPDFKLRGVQFGKANGIGLRIYHDSMPPSPVMPLTWSSMERMFSVVVNTDAFADYAALVSAINAEIAATVATQAEAAFIYVDVGISAGDPIDPLSHAWDRVLGGFAAVHGDRILLLADSGLSGSEVYYDARIDVWLTVPTGILATWVPDALSVAAYFTPGQIYSWFLTGNRTLANPSAMPAGTYLLRVIQDAVGGRTLAFGSDFRFPGGVPPVISPAANAEDILTLVSFGGPEVYLSRTANLTTP